MTAASIVNIGASLRFHGIEASETGAPLIGAAVLLAGCAFAALAIKRGHGNLAYAATFLRALAAIYSAGGQTATGVGTAAVLVAVLVLVGVFAGRRGAARRTGT